MLLSSVERSKMMSDWIPGEGWKFLTGDVCWEDHGGVWYKQAVAGPYWLLRYENMAEWGDGASGAYVQTSCIDLREVPPEAIRSALGSYGWRIEKLTCNIIDNCSGDIIAEFSGEEVAGELIRDGDNSRWDLVLVDALLSHGTYAPMDEEQAEFTLDEYDDPIDAEAVATELLERCAAAADLMMDDEGAVAAKMAREVNRIGSTAADFMRGDSLAGLRTKADALLRGEDVSLSKEDSLMLRMYGAAGGRTLGGAIEAKLAAAGQVIAREGEE
jgi:hypothetical protein